MSGNSEGKVFTELVRKSLLKHVQKQKSKHKWLRGGIEFVDVIPKSPSGKILRKDLKELEKAKRMQNGARL